MHAPLIANGAFVGIAPCMLHRQRRIRRRLHCAGQEKRSELAHTCSLAQPKTLVDTVKRHVDGAGPPPPEDQGQKPDEFKQTWDSILGLTKADLHSEVMLNYRTWPLRAGQRGEPAPSAFALFLLFICLFVYLFIS